MSQSLLTISILNFMFWQNKKYLITYLQYWLTLFLLLRQIFVVKYLFTFHFFILFSWKLKRVKSSKLKLEGRRLKNQKGKKTEVLEDLMVLNSDTWLFLWSRPWCEKGWWINAMENLFLENVSMLFKPF